jgi:hypothetical protein
MKKNVVLIVGAGASKDLNSEFGLGSDLIQQIENRVTENRDLVTFFTKVKNIDYGVLQTFKNNLSNYRKESKFKSIDEFLTEVAIFPEYINWREEYLFIGKISILFHITGWESHFKNLFSVDNLKNTWIGEVINYLNSENILEHYNTGKVIQSSLRIITFNYDRILEYCLTEYYKKYEPKFSKAIVQWINNYVTHVYDELDYTKGELSFGHLNSDLQEIEKHIDKIKIAYDSREFRLNKKLSLTNISKEVELPENIIQLDVITNPYLGTIGFGFDYFNCRNIGLTSRDKNISANLIVKDQSGTFENRRNLTNTIRTMFPNVDFTYSTCKDFLKDLFAKPSYI